VQSKSKLKDELGLDDAECAVADIASSDLSSIMKGCAALIVASSATPKIDYFSMPGFLWNKFVMRRRAMPGFTFAQTPEVVRPRGPLQLRHPLRHCPCLLEAPLRN
jgi:hypothetical protein